MEMTHRRHDISDEKWALIKDMLPGQRGQWGGIANDNRLFVNAVFWVLRTGAQWRDLPPDFGKWHTVYMRFARWRDKGVWERLLEVLCDSAEMEWLMIDSTCVKVHPDAAGAIGGNQTMARSKGGLTQKYIWPWMRMVCRSDSLSRKVPALIARLQLS